MMAVLRTRGFPDLPQRPVGAVDWVVIGNWQSCDRAIGFGPFAWLAAKQIPLASVGVGSDDSKIRARADVLMSHSGWNHDEISSAHLDIFALLAAKSQRCRAVIDAEHLVRGAVVVGKRIDTISPRIAPIVLSESALEHRSAIFGVRRNGDAIQ